ncbi:endothelial differentiation-related factor 1 [Octopus vulgaris]|uniref:Endothelial differentiation-related factor 1 n=3 Tax=Octopus TaxID=6643 RepID=A0AA36FI60_OCTVU|nr:endothelial differentiation-related factor 1 [Octopus bimaculoides]XP_029649105.1 endothelial differentiation-related factor 1 [Octopus sinensis]CAI9738517.1 endothelial differentiation-related factor 1 [Octopus vulgaris]|eukprot:XP_014778866.1 PREDICTED: endothelial differentiation-related factor 1-like [Octopus bimaculoides]
MAESDWNEVTYIGKRAKAGQLRSKQAVTTAQRTGAAVETTKRFSAGQNKQHAANINANKLDQETEELHISKVSIDVSRLIQQCRQRCNMTQKELATKINEKQQVINEYESGKAVPNQQILGKLERALGTKLRGKDKGKPFTKK